MFWGINGYKKCPLAPHAGQAGIKIPRCRICIVVSTNVGAAITAQFPRRVKRPCKNTAGTDAGRCNSPWTVPGWSLQSARPASKQAAPSLRSPKNEHEKTTVRVHRGSSCIIFVLFRFVFVVLRGVSCLPHMLSQYKPSLLPKRAYLRPTYGINSFLYRKHSRFSRSCQ